MPVDQARCRIVFEKLDGELRKLAHKLDRTSVHKVRTYSRRVEALLGELDPEPGRNDRKLLKQLARFRKQAGRVRDLDVQMSNLRGLKIASEAGQKAQLQRELAQERGKRAKKLEHSLDKGKIRELRRRLKKAAADLQFPGRPQPLTLTLHKLSELEPSRGPLTEKTLHQYRIAGKRARYLAEFAGKDPEAQRLVENLKRMQDVIGDWHDWLKLAERAEQLFGGVRDSPLVAALRNLTRAKFRQGVDAVVAMRGGIGGKKPVRPEAAAGRAAAAQTPAGPPEWNASVA
jgi:CHAD domain-containing protein